MKIITGRAKTGKTKYIYDEIKVQLDKDTDRNLILLVPDLMTYEVEYDIIERLNLDGIMNLEVLSFKRLVHRIIDELGGRNDLSDIDSLGKVMLLKGIFEESSDELKLFKKASVHTGFLKQFNFLIQELKQNLISVEDLEKAIKESDNIFLKSKLSDIALIYSKYNEISKDKFLDEEDIYELVISKIGASNYIKNSRIWIDGFESFNKQRLNIIRELNEYSQDLSISLNIDRDYVEDLQAFDDWEVFKITWDTFKSLEALVDKDIETINLCESKIPNEEIRMIEKNIFSIDFQQYYKEVDNIKVISAMDSYTEVELAGQKIIGLVRDQGYRWRDIKIAVGDLDNYMIDIKKAFFKFEIPYFADVKRDITNNPISKYILSILDMFIWNFKYDDVFQYLKTGFSPLNNTQINCIENHVLENGIQGLKWFETIDDEFLEDARQGFTMDFKDRIDEFRKLNTISEITEFLFSYFSLHKIDNKIKELIDRFRIQDKYEEESEYLQVWNSIMNIFEQILSIGEDKDISPLEYRKMLEAGLMEIKISIIPPTIDRVEIGDIDRIGVSKSKILFILGANEGKLDSNKSKGLLLDEEIERLSDYNINIINSSDFSYFKKKHMLYKVFTSPREKLYISYALGTSDGKPLEPSLYIGILNMIFPRLKDQVSQAKESSYGDITNRAGTYDILVENMNNYVKGKELDKIWKSVYSWYKINDPQRYELIKAAFNYNNEIPKLGEESMGKVFGDHITMTVSKLENYAECQFKYFVRNILKAEERKLQKVELYDLGNIYHEALERFIDKLINSGKKPQDLNESEINTMVERSIEEVLQKSRGNIPALNANNRNKYLENKTERVIKRAASILIQQLQRGEFTPKYTELKIGIIDSKDKDLGKKDHIDSLEIEAKDKKIKLRGIIDRVDIFQDDIGDIYLNIIDYKSSSKDIDFTDAYEGLQLQLLVYSKALQDQGEKLFGKKPKLAGLYYYHIDDPIIKDKDEGIDDEILKSLKLKGLVLKDKDIVVKMDREIGQYSDIIPAGFKKDGDFTKNSNVLTEEEFDTILEYINYKIKDLSESILDGNFNINPYRKKDGSNPCQYCEYLGICQFDELLGHEYRSIKSMNRDKFLENLSQGGLN